MVVLTSRSAVRTSLLRLRSDDQLVAGFRAGDEDAFRVIHDRYRPRLLAYARQMLAQSHDAEDAIQDVFVRAYVGLRTSERELALRPWLYRVAHNRCIDQLRRPAPSPPSVWHAIRTSMVQDPIAHVGQRESLRFLLCDVGRLPPQQRSALLMRELGGMAYVDIAEALGASVSAVKSLLVRARSTLVKAGEARNAACGEIRESLVLTHDRGVRPTATAVRHMHDCAGCRQFHRELRGVSNGMRSVTPGIGVAAIAGKLGLGAWIRGGGAAGAGAAATAGAATSNALSCGDALGSSVSHLATLLAAGAVVIGGGLSAAGAVHPPPRTSHRVPANEEAAAVPGSDARAIVHHPLPAQSASARAQARPIAAARREAPLRAGTQSITATATATRPGATSNPGPASASAWKTGSRRRESNPQAARTPTRTVTPTVSSAASGSIPLVSGLVRSAGRDLGNTVRLLSRQRR